jgi:hypothetical protein
MTGTDAGGGDPVAKPAAGAAAERLVHADCEGGHGKAVRSLSQRELAPAHAADPGGTVSRPLLCEDGLQIRTRTVVGLDAQRSGGAAVFI